MLQSHFILTLVVSMVLLIGCQDRNIVCNSEKTEEDNVARTLKPFVGAWVSDKVRFDKNVPNTLGHFEHIVVYINRLTPEQSEERKIKCGVDNPFKVKVVLHYKSTAIEVPDSRPGWLVMHDCRTVINLGPIGSHLSWNIEMTEDNAMILDAQDFTAYLSRKKDSRTIFHPNTME